VPENRAPLAPRTKDAYGQHVAAYGARLAGRRNDAKALGDPTALGLGPANVKREPLVQAAPRALAVEQQRELLRAAEASSARDPAIVTLLLDTALRLNEIVSLDVDDVSISARKGLLVIRSGKGDLYREVPLNPSSRQAVADCSGSEPRPTGSGRCSSGLRGGGCRPEQSIWSCAASRRERN
jgi:site-specific recombinase XerC